MAAPQGTGKRKRQREHSLLSKGYAALVSRAFYSFYHEFAWTYDAVAWLVSGGLWYQWTQAALPYLQGRVLELGCGTGYLQKTLARARPGTAVGIDESPQMLALTLRREQQSDCQGCRVHVARGLSQALPFPAGRFQTVLATFPSNYIIHPQTLTEIRRVLDTSGRLLLVDAATFNRRGLYERMVGLAYWLAFLPSPATAPAAPTAAADNLTEQHPYRDILERAGFTVEVHTEQIAHSSVHVFVAVPRP